MENIKFITDYNCSDIQSHFSKYYERLTRSCELKLVEIHMCENGFELFKKSVKECNCRGLLTKSGYIGYFSGINIFFTKECNDFEINQAKLIYSNGSTEVINVFELD